MDDIPQRRFAIEEKAPRKAPATTLEIIMPLIAGSLSENVCVLKEAPIDQIVDILEDIADVLDSGDSDELYTIDDDVWPESIIGVLSEFIPEAKRNALTPPFGTDCLLQLIPFVPQEFQERLDRISSTRGWRKADAINEFVRTLKSRGLIGAHELEQTQELKRDDAGPWFLAVDDLRTYRTPMRSAFLPLSAFQRSDERIASYEQLLKRFSSLLFYFKRIGIPDPFDYFFIEAPGHRWQGTKLQFDFSQTPIEIIRARWCVALDCLATFEPLILQGSIVTTPYSSIHDEAHSEKYYVCGAERMAYFEEIYGKLSPAVQGSMRGHGQEWGIFETLTWLRNKHALPLAVTPMSDAILKAEYEFRLSQHLAPMERHTAIELINERMPGVRDVPLKALIELRSGDDAFYPFRENLTRALGLALAHRSENESASDFEANVGAAFRDILTPAIIALKATARGRNTLADYTAGAISFGINMVTGNVLAASVDLASHVGQYIAKKLDATSRKTAEAEGLLLDLYASLIQPE